MKKAFDANVSRARPRLRLGALVTDSVVEETVAPAVDVEAIAEQVAREHVTTNAPPEARPTPDLTSAFKARVAVRSERVTAARAIEQALAAPAPAPVHTPTPMVAHAEPPPAVVEVQTAPSPGPAPEQFDPLERRERLKDRLRAVRENPRPEPLPDTVAEAGVLAVERISALQSELTKARAVNLALTQDLEAARRQAERATEEARLRMDEARRLAGEMESRVTLLSELEHELQSLEGERNEALLALQDARQRNDAADKEKTSLHEALAKKDAEMNDCLAEEERLASELESAQESMSSLKRASDVLKGERDTLARQVSDLTRERAELLEARKALEAVHRALSSAVLR
jgi:predicted  nucleic acid-binding Zn-ribbon protein